eukprot:TRINITY_DN10956_c0_g1_i1.p1 TRINITY_DN10956_c0_g1~~TRINITY_DN10956_c0_g1_i1.p1  ORF type:complete len:217 (-),score=11.69 TRINITY_DN10956_c0_g1_i1:125-775(-)
MEISTALEERAVSIEGGLDAFHREESMRTMIVYTSPGADHARNCSTAIKAVLSKNRTLIKSWLGILGLLCAMRYFSWVGFASTAWGSHDLDTESSLWAALSTPNLSMTSPFLGYRCMEFCGSVGPECATVKNSPCLVDYSGCCCDNVYPCLEQKPGEVYRSYTCVNYTIACGNILSQKCAGKNQDPCADEYNGKCCAGFNLCRDYQAGTYICQRYI